MIINIIFVIEFEAKFESMKMRNLVVNNKLGGRW